MLILENYPTVCMFLSFFVTSCVFSYFPPMAKIISFAAAVVILVLILVLPKKLLRETLKKTLVMSLSAMLLSCAVSYAAFDIYAAGFDSFDETQDYVQLEIKEKTSSLPYEAQYEAEIVSSSSVQKGTKLLVSTALLQLERGDIVEGEVTFSSLDGYLGSFDAKSYYIPKNIMLTAEGEMLRKVGHNGAFSLSNAFSDLNDHLNSMINAHTNGESGGLTSAVLLGNRDGIYDSTTRDFRRLGISHLLVVSGTHFSVVVAMLGNVLKKLKIKRKTRSVLNIAIVLFFMGLTGMTPSVVRAGLMHIFAQLSMILSRKPNVLNSFALSGCVLVVLDPLSAADYGLQLSFAAAYSCIMLRMMRGGILRPIKRYFKRHIPHLKKLSSAVLSLIETVLMTSFTNISLLPLLWLNFGEISLLSLPANIVFIPLVSMLMYLGGAYLLLYPLKLFIVPLAFLIDTFCAFILRIAEVTARLDIAEIPINYGFTVYFLIPLTVIVLIIPYLGRKNKLKAVGAGALVLLLFGISLGYVRMNEADETYFVYTADKNNDGFVLRADGKLLMCEMSDASYSYIYNLLDETENMHVTEIEAMLFTHYHSKHIQLLSKLSDREILRSIILTKPINEKEESVFLSLMSLAKEKGIKVGVYSVGSDIPFYGCNIVCEREYITRSTHPMTTVSVETGDTDVFVTSCSFNEMKNSDSIQKAETADVLILGRHSPIYKKVLELTLDEPRTVFVSEAAYEIADDDTKKYFDRYAVIGEDRLSFSEAD